MSHDSIKLQQLTVRTAWIAASLAVVCLLLAVAAVLVPISAADSAELAAGKRLRPLPQDQVDLQPLLVRLTSRELIRPASLQAAVKDDGTAQRLLKSLKLQGVIEMDGQLVAYIQVEKEGVQTVHRGDKVLEFAVEKIEPGAVSLSLQGVVVTLTH